MCKCVKQLKHVTQGSNHTSNAQQISLDERWFLEIRRIKVCLSKLVSNRAKQTSGSTCLYFDESNPDDQIFELRNKILCKPQLWATRLHTFLEICGSWNSYLAVTLFDRFRQLGMPVWIKWNSASRRLLEVILFRRRPYWILLIAFNGKAILLMCVGDPNKLLEQLSGTDWWRLFWSDTYRQRDDHRLLL